MSGLRRAAPVSTHAGCDAGCPDEVPRPRRPGAYRLLLRLLDGAGRVDLAPAADIHITVTAQERG